MKGHIFLVVNTILITLFGSSYFTAADTVIRVSDLDQSKVVQTIIPPEPEPEPESEPVVAVAQPVSISVAHLTTTAPVKGNSIAIAGHTLAIKDVDDTSVDAGDHVNKYGDKFLYGHNSSAVFGGLANLSVGQTFSVDYDGVVNTYQIAKMVTFAKNFERGTLEYGDSSYNYFPALARRAQFGKNGPIYDLSIMTCAGTSLGGGDATHRLVIFANKI